MADNPLIVFAEFFDPNGRALGHYWLNHNDPKERSCLGQRCADTFKEGGSVSTYAVSEKGKMP